MAPGRHGAGRQARRLPAWWLRTPGPCHPSALGGQVVLVPFWALVLLRSRSERSTARSADMSAVRIIPGPDSSSVVRL